MKTFSFSIATAVAAIAFPTCVAFGGSSTITAAAKVVPAASTHRAVTPAVNPSGSVTSKSEFVVPRGPTDGRDPFFPNSSRPYASEAVVKIKNDTALADFEFSLKGISGSAEQPLAIINNTTFTTGEENEVIIKSKRIKIRCIEINMTAGTVLYEYGGARRVLKLSSR